MAKASDNQYPKITFAESAAPSTPSTGLAYLYVKTDGKAYLKDDAGTETDITGAGGGGLTLLDSWTYSTDVTSVTFTGLSASYDRLIIKGGLRSDLAGTTNDGILLQMGDGSIDTGSNYRYMTKYFGTAGDGGSSSASATSILLNYTNPAAGDTASTISYWECVVSLYAGTTYNKAVMWEGAGADSSFFYSTRTAGLYVSTTAVVDQLKFAPQSGTNFTGGFIKVYGE